MGLVVYMHACDDGSELRYSWKSRELTWNIKASDTLNYTLKFSHVFPLAIWIQSWNIFSKMYWIGRKSSIKLNRLISITGLSLKTRLVSVIILHVCDENIATINLQESFILLYLYSLKLQGHCTFITAHVYWCWLRKKIEKCSSPHLPVLWESWSLKFWLFQQSIFLTLSKLQSCCLKGDILFTVLGSSFYFGLQLELVNML